jgi:hypothetical protein
MAVRMETDGDSNMHHVLPCDAGGPSVHCVTLMGLSKR